MPKKQTIQKQSGPATGRKGHVNADAIGEIYGITGRYVLQLAAEGKIPCLRLGKKCVRFNPEAVAKALEG